MPISSGGVVLLLLTTLALSGVAVSRLLRPTFPISFTVVPEQSVLRGIVK